MDTVLFSLALPKKLKQELKLEAAHDHRSLTGQILYILQQRNTPTPPEQNIHALAKAIATELQKYHTKVEPGRTD